jgi:polar amino acid transport system substrate-binding protein
MPAMLRSLPLAAALFTAACAASAPTMTDALRKEYAPTGVLRAGINYGNPVIVQKDPAGGAPRGVGPELARGRARRQGVEITYVTYDTAGKLANGAKEGAWDVGFLAIDPERAQEITFTAPYVQIEGTYLVRSDSKLARVGDVDRGGVRVSVGLKTAYDLYLTRELKQAELVRSPTSADAIKRFLDDPKIDACAGVRQPLDATARAHPGLRVMTDSFMIIPQAAAMPKGREQASRHFAAFIDEMKASGFVARALDKSGNPGLTVPR